jgi:hypothetical protein
MVERVAFDSFGQAFETAARSASVLGATWPPHFWSTATFRADSAPDFAALEIGDSRKSLMVLALAEIGSNPSPSALRVATGTARWPDFRAESGKKGVP